MMHFVLTLLGNALAIAGFAASLYLALIVFAGWRLHRRRQDHPVNPTTARFRSFAVVVPAHDEELLIEHTLRSLATIDYPKERFRIFVVADNCADQTAMIARKYACVLERFDRQRRGKGYALKFAFERIFAEWPECEAVVVVDADTQCDAQLLSVLNDELLQGEQAIQVAYLGSNVGESWRTRLQQAAWSLFNFLRPLGRVAIGGSAPLLGNGMCFTRALLEQTRWQAFSVTEDVEFALRLVTQGTRIHFTSRARVYGQMARSSSQAAAQRLRWEEGRSQSRRRFVRTLLHQWFETPRWLLVESLLDLLFPPIAALAGMLALACAIALISSNGFALALSCGALLLLGGSVAAGLMAARSPASVYLALLASPLYLLWKISLAPRRWFQRKNLLSQWVRTSRHPVRQNAATSVKK